MADYKTQASNFLNILLRFRRIFIFLVGFIGFFLFYNTFLIDRTLENLRFSLQQTSLAYDVYDLQGLDLLLNQIMVEEVMPEKINIVNVANLEYVRNAISMRKSYKTLDYMKVSLDSVIKDKETKRGTFLLILDTLNRYLRYGTTRLFGWVSDFIRVKRITKPIGTVGAELLDKAAALEKEAKLDEALASYSQFINDYPLYDRMGIVKLRLAYLYHRLGQYNKAHVIYREIIREYAGRKEAYIAQGLLVRLQQMGSFLKKQDILLGELAQLRADDIKARQNILYQLGTINLLLLNGNEAKRFFKRAELAYPQSDLAKKARFTSAWVSKEQNKLDEAIAEFTGIEQENPNAMIALDSRYELADIHHKEGRYQEAIDIYLKLAEEAKGDPLAPLCLFQAGASYMYDLNDDVKAGEVFAKLLKEHPATPYAIYLSPGNPIGLFVTYLVPRATRVVTWRVGAILSLAGYAGEIVKFKDYFKESSYNQALNQWLKEELPDTVGNLYVDIKGTELKFLENNITVNGRITMGKFSVRGEAEGQLEATEEGGLRVVLTKAALDRIPIPPFLINNALSGLTLITRKHIPFMITKISMNRGETILDGYGSKRMLNFLKTRARKFIGEFEIEDIKDPKEVEKMYKLFKEKFPESDFSPVPKEDLESLFLDFFTRIYLYIDFKLLETVKDTKLDYERSIRTLGRLLVKKGKFRVKFKEADINAQLARLIGIEFPWIANMEFLYDIKGLELHFTDEGDIKFESYINLGHTHFPIMADEVKSLKVEGQMSLDIDSESKIPRPVFKEMYINGRPFSVDRLNFITSRGLELLKEGHLPFQLDEVGISRGEIILKGRGANDFTRRVFSDPHLFVIFQIREWDLGLVGIQRLKERPQDIGDYFKGKASLGKEGPQYGEILIPVPGQIGRATEDRYR